MPMTVQQGPIPAPCLYCQFPCPDLGWSCCAECWQQELPWTLMQDSLLDVEKWAVASFVGLAALSTWSPDRVVWSPLGRPASGRGVQL